MIVSGVTCSPKIQLHTTIYDNKFKDLENNTFPYSAIDVHPTLNHLAFLIVGANDYLAITKSKSIHRSNNVNFFIICVMFDWISSRSSTSQWLSWSWGQNQIQSWSAFSFDRLLWFWVRKTNIFSGFHQYILFLSIFHRARDLINVDKFIRDTKGKKIRTFGYGIFNTNYTLRANMWEDDSVDLLLNEFMKKMHGDDFIRHEIPESYVTIFDPKWV